MNQAFFTGVISVSWRVLKRFAHTIFVYVCAVLSCGPDGGMCVCLWSQNEMKLALVMVTSVCEWNPVRPKGVWKPQHVRQRTSHRCMVVLSRANMGILLTNPAAQDCSKPSCFPKRLTANGFSQFSNLSVELFFADWIWTQACMPQSNGSPGYCCYPSRFQCEVGTEAAIREVLFIALEGTSVIRSNCTTVNQRPTDFTRFYTFPVTCKI